MAADSLQADDLPPPGIKRKAKLSDYGRPKPGGQSRSLLAPPTGLGRAAWGSLNHDGYDMSNQSYFYGRFLLEVVTNKSNDQKRYTRNLSQLPGKHRRMDANNYKWFGYWAINQARNFNVMYSRAENGRGKISHRETLILDGNDWDTFNEARAYSNGGGSDVRARYISFQFPAKGEKFVWIDLNWPLRSIYIPVSHKSQPGERGLATYAQINFRHLSGNIPTGGWREAGSQTYTHFNGDDKLGLFMPGKVMRVDLEFLANILCLPENQRVESALNGLQICNADVVDHYWGEPGVGVNERYVRNKGRSVADYFSANGGVELMYEELPPNFIKGLVQDLISFGLGLIPTVGPLLAVASDLAFAMMDNVDGNMREFSMEEFGTDMGLALFETALGFKKKYKKKKKWERGPEPGDADLYEDPLAYPLLGMDAADARWSPLTKEQAAKEKAEPNDEPDALRPDGQPTTTAPVVTPAPPIIRPPVGHGHHIPR